MSAGLSIFVLVVLVIVGWFALGTHTNVRKGHRFLEWLQEGLPLLGEKTTLRWLGSSVVQLKIEKAHDPFRRAEVLVVLEPRDVPPLWLLSRLRGRRDLLIVRTELRTVPRQQVEILRPAAWSTRAIDREVNQLRWQPLSVDGQPFHVYSPPPVAEVRELISETDRCALPLVRVGVRQLNNALEVQWQLPAQPDSTSRTAFEAVQRLAQKV